MQTLYQQESTKQYNFKTSLKVRVAKEPPVGWSDYEKCTSWKHLIFWKFSAAVHRPTEFLSTGQPSSLLAHNFSVDIL